MSGMAEKSRLKLLGINSFWLYFAEFIPRLGGLLIVPIWSRLIEPAQYAHWVLCLTTVEFFAVISNLGLVSFIVKVLYRYHDERADDYFGMALEIMMVATTLVAVLAACGTRWI